MADKITDVQLREFLANVRQVIDRAVAGLSTHDQFIYENCAARGL
jgi:tryptophan halogenase